MRPDGTGVEARSPLALAVLVHTAADKYGVKRLVKLADAEFALQAKATGQSQALIEAVEAIYDVPPEHKKKMRDIVVQIVAINYKNFKIGAAFEGCQAVFDTAPLVADVLEWLMDERTLMMGFTKYRCPSAICDEATIIRTMPICNTETVYRHCPYCGTRWSNAPANGWVRIRPGS